MCQDPRDTICGTLALADWTRATTLTPKGAGTMQAHTHDVEMKVPEYSSSPSDVAIDVIPHFHSIDDLWSLAAMLKMSAETDADVSRIVGFRQQSPLQPRILSDNEVIDASNQTKQSFAQFVDGAVQLTADSA